MNKDDTNTNIQRGMNDINQAFKERDLKAKAQAMGLPYVNLITTPLNPDLALIFSYDEAQAAHAVLFFKSGKQLRLAAMEPKSPATENLVKKLQSKGYEVSLALASEESFESACRMYFKNKYKQSEPIQYTPEEIKPTSAEEEILNLESLKNKIEQSRYDVALGYVQTGAWKARATDIHFQPEAERVLVRFRIDGVLHPVFYLSRIIYDGILKEIKQQSHLKLNITSMPQDGQYGFNIGNRQINIRVSIVPTIFGEACVIRLQDLGHDFVSFSELGYEGEALRNLEESVKLPHGLILITGPTGAGKTTTMYSLLRSIDTKAKKAVTLEDPVEYRIPGIMQSQINPELGYTFSVGLKAALRQDPNVIMVGEIRDLETAETAAQASLTGHLVISTLHTNSAIESIPRLTNMGVKSFILAPALDLIVAQRLVRRICANCVEERKMTEGELEHCGFILNQISAKGIEAPDLPKTLRQGKGCALCGQSGYRGQIAVAEVLRFNQELRDMLLLNKPMPQIYDYIAKRCKMLELHQDGILKAIKGITTLDEVYRVSV